jgi:L-gulonate 3-dehydrogenase
MTGHVAIVGAGLIGRSWAVAFARGGHCVKMYDPAEGAALRSYNLLPEMLAELESTDLLGGKIAADVQALISVVPTLDECVRGCSYLQESAFENRDIKAQLFSELDELVDDHCILASSTSVILPSLFTGHIKHKAQCIVAHPLNPPHLIPAIEIVPAPWTNAAITARAKALHESIGQKPIVMNKEIDGFLMNRLQAAIIEESMRLLEAGYVTAEEIDISVKHGLAMRWAFIGPFETMDLNAPGGIRDYIGRFDKGFIKIREKSQWRADWQGETLDRLTAERTTLLPRDKILDRQKWRDKMLMQLAGLKRKISKG